MKSYIYIIIFDNNKGMTGPLDGELRSYIVNLK